MERNVSQSTSVAVRRISRPCLVKCRCAPGSRAVLSMCRSIGLLGLLAIAACRETGNGSSDAAGGNTLVQKSTDAQLALTQSAVNAGESFAAYCTAGGDAGKTVSALKKLTGITDCAQLATSLQNARTLRLDGFSLRDLSPLAGLTGLRWLNLANNKSLDFSKIGMLAGLKALVLDQTKISDLRSLRTLVNVEMLSLDDTGVSDLTPLGSLTKLRVLSLNHTNVSDLRPLAALPLESLYLDGTAVRNLAQLKALTKLRSVTLDDDSLADVTPLAGMTGLVSVSLSGNAIKDVSPLAGLSRVTMLQLDGNPIEVNVDRCPLTAANQPLASFCKAYLEQGGH